LRGLAFCTMYFAGWFMEIGVVRLERSRRFFVVGESAHFFQLYL
jgi:hypothetical protein